MKKYLSCSIIAAFAISGVVGCSQGTSPSSSGSPIAPIVSSPDPEITINTSATVPVVNGFNTAGKIYLHNNSNRTISGIKVSLENPDVKSKMSKILTFANSLAGKSITDDHGFVLLNDGACSKIAAGSECVINFVTPGLKAGERGHSVIAVGYTGKNAKYTQYNSIINYEYTDPEEFSGVNFYGGVVPAIASHGGHAYVTGYILGGGSAGTLYNNVRLVANKPDDIVILNGFSNGTDIVAGQVIPVEIKVNITNNIENNATITPEYYSSSSSIPNNFAEVRSQAPSAKGLKSGGGSLGSPLNVSILPLEPQETSTNLVFGMVPTVDLQSGATSGMVTVTNNGNADLAAGGLSVVVDPAYSSLVSTSSSCDGVSLEAFAGNTCNVTFSISASNTYETGSVPISYVVDGQTVGQDVLYFSDGPQYAALSISTMPAAVSTPVDLDTSTLNAVSYTVVNRGTESATITSYSLGMDSAGQSIITSTNILTNTCTIGSTIAPGGSCMVSVRYMTGTTTGDGVAYLNMQISYLNNNTTKTASFLSMPFRFRVIGYPILAIANISTLITNANAFQVESTTTTVTNTGTQAGIIDSFTLSNVSGYASVQPQFDTTGGTWCTAGQSLAPGGTCNLKIKYGPVPYTESTNQNGVESLAINYHGGYPNITATATKDFNYSFYGNDAYVEISNVSVTGITPGVGGLGTQASPWQASGSTTATQGVVLTYINKSSNYTLHNFMVNTNNLPRGLRVTNNTCSNVNLVEGGSGTCAVTIAVNKDYESRVNDSSFTSSGAGVSGLTLYPTASWNVNATGSSSTVNQVYTQPAVYQSTGESGFFLAYSQLNMNFVLSANSGNYGNSPTVNLTITPTQTSGYSSIGATVSRVGLWLESVPTTASSNCTIENTVGTYGVTCSGITAAETITYYMPSYLNTGESADIPLVYGASANSPYIYLNPSWQFIKYIK